MKLVLFFSLLLISALCRADSSSSSEEKDTKESSSSSSSEESKEEHKKDRNEKSRPNAEVKEKHRRDDNDSSSSSSSSSSSEETNEVTVRSRDRRAIQFEVGVTNGKRKGLCLAESEGGNDERDRREAELELRDEPGEKRKVLKRTVRDTFSSMSGQFLMRLESTIISNCKQTGHRETASSLQDAYDTMKTCLGKKKIFITPKSEYIASIEECSKEAVKKTKNCLAEEQKYFPDFILDLVKSVVNFMYDDIDYLRVDLVPCIPMFNKYSVQRSYIQCLTDTATQTHDTSQIPTSKASFCQKFIPASYCFTNMIRDHCTRTANLDKFREDYINAMKVPCEKKESS